MQHTIRVPETHHLVEWLRFIQDARPKNKLSKKDKCTIDCRESGFLQPYHLSSLACLIEEYARTGARIDFKLPRRSRTTKFLDGIKFTKYWNNNFNRNSCFLNFRKDVLPVWQLHNERIDAFGELAQGFYSNHCLPGKDLSKLKLIVVEALNNIYDHSESVVKGFVFTQYFPKKTELVISICDLGVGIANKVNTYLKKNGEKELSHNDALQKAMTKGFTTRSVPHNGGLGLDNILSHVRTSDGEIIIVTNKAFYSNKVKDSITLAPISDDMKLSFNGTYLVIKLNTSKFLETEKEVNIEEQLF
jgi:hypothetical protein